jgi:hypothetical protein
MSRGRYKELQRSSQVMFDGRVGRVACRRLIGSLRRVVGVTAVFAVAVTKFAARNQISGESGAGRGGGERRECVVGKEDGNELLGGDVGSGGGGAARRALARGAAAHGGGGGARGRGGRAAAVSAGGLFIDARVLREGAAHVGGPGVQADPGGARDAEVSGGRGRGRGRPVTPDRGRASGAASHGRHCRRAGRGGERQEQGADRGPCRAAGAEGGCPRTARAGGGTTGTGSRTT